MPLSNRCSVKASSLLESVIAMTMIAICLGLGMVTFGMVMKTDNNIAFYQAQQKVKELLYETKQKQLIDDEEYDYKSFKIQKRVEGMESDFGHKVNFTVTINGKKKTYQYIVSF